MATVKITALPAITGAASSLTDVIPVVDVSSDITSKITREEFFKNIPGNVGIGTSAPSRPLHVVTAGATISAALLQNDTGDTAVFTRSQDNGTNTLYFGDTTNFQSGFLQYAHAVDTLTARSAGTITLQTGGASERFRIDAAGVVSLPASTTETKSLEIGVGRSGNGLSHLDLVGDATYGDYGARFIRNAGANANSQINHRGTGALILVTEDPGPISLFTSNTERMRIHASGGVSIGNTTDPGVTNLSVTGGIRSTGAQGIGYDTGAGVAVTQLTSRTTTVPTTGNKMSGAITLFTAVPAVGWVNFVVPNTAIAITDTVTFAVRGAANSYVAFASNIVAGTSFTVSIAAQIGTASDTPIVNFNIIRGVAA